MRIDPSRDFGARECPGCAGEVPANHNRCPLCGYDFPARGPRQRAGLLAAALLMLALILAFLLGR